MFSKEIKFLFPFFFRKLIKNGKKILFEWITQLHNQEQVMNDNKLNKIIIK